MNDFTASNGRTIRTHGHPFVMYTLGGIASHHFSVADADALREFFRAEEDDQLGRWRHPENPDWVVYPAREGHAMLVFNERHGVPSRFDPDKVPAVAGVDVDVARAYLAAHPQRKPWHNAECGDSWYVEPHGVVYAVVGDRRHADGLWFTRANVYGVVENMQLDDPRIKSARRIWPEVSA